MQRPPVHSLCLSCDHLKRRTLAPVKYDWVCGMAEVDADFPLEPAQPVRSCPGWRTHAGMLEMAALGQDGPEEGVKTVSLIAHCPGNAGTVLERARHIFHTFLEETQGRYVVIAKGKQFVPREFLKKLEVDGRVLRAWQAWLDDVEGVRPVAKGMELNAWLGEMDDRARGWRWHGATVLHPGRIKIWLTGKVEGVPLALRTLFQASGAQAVGME